MMAGNENFSSDFTQDFNPHEAWAVIDFSRAKRLNTTGSTCEAYVTELKHRRVFVKRLKEQFRNSARYRAAFEKEYEIGVSLSHPALPFYIDFHGDYIVMNYIDGRTLAEMLASGDEWLSNGRNAIKVLEELLDVLEYLHRKGVIHCDIKADNVLLTYSNNNVALIDLDKVYTSHLADTSGSATKYGLEESDKRNTDIDFAGLGRIAEQLAGIVKTAGVRKTILRFSSECKKTGITAEELKSILRSGPYSEREERRQRKLEEDRKDNRQFLYIIIGFLVVAILAFFLKVWFDKPEQDVTEKNEVVTNDSTSENESDITDVPGEVTISEPSTKNAWEDAQPNQPAKQSAKELDQYLTVHFKPLLELVDNTMCQFDNGELDEKQQRAALDTIYNLSFNLRQEAYVWCKNAYPNMSITEAQLTVAASPVFESVTERVAEASDRLAERFKVSLE